MRRRTEQLYRRAGTCRRAFADESGLTLVEVIVSAVMVVLIGSGFVALGAVSQTTGDQQRRSAAYEVAQQDQERMRAMSTEQLSRLNQVDREVDLDGVTYNVTSTGKFLQRTSGSDSCTATGSGAADYIRTTTSVTWDGNKRTPVLINGLITPPAGGGVIVRVNDQTNAPIAGAKVLASGSSTQTSSTARSAVTDSSGCTLFAGLPIGDYSLAASLSGYVDFNGNSTTSATVTATQTATATQPFRLGRAGSLTASFTTTIGSTTFPNQLAPSLTWFNNGMSESQTTTPSSPTASIGSGTKLFPFITGTAPSYTNNYTVWAGRCSATQPTSNLSYASVQPGLNGAVTVPLPAMNLRVNYRTSNSTTRIRPEDVKLTDACNQSWFPPISASASSATTGSLTYPGQPFGNYNVCADYNGYRVYGTLANTSYTGTTTTLTIDSRSSSNRGSC